MTAAPAPRPTPTPSDCAFCFNSIWASSTSSRVSALACSATCFAATPRRWLPLRGATSVDYLPVVDANLHGLPVELPDGALRVHRLRVGECAQDVDGAADTVLVAACQAARDHLRRRAVALPACRAKAEGEPRAVAARVDRNHVHGGAVDPVRRAELDLAEEVAPVRGQRRESCFPRLAQSRRCQLGRRFGDWIRVDHLESRADVLRIESLEQPTDGVALSDDGECQSARSGAKRLQRPE